MTLPDHTPSRGQYVNGCRCDGCRAAATAYQVALVHKRMRARQLINGRYTATTGTHGRASTYTNHGCRCAPCTTAIRDYNRGRRRAS